VIIGVLQANQLLAKGSRLGELDSIFLFVLNIYMKSMITLMHVFHSYLRNCEFWKWTSKGSLMLILWGNINLKIPRESIKKTVMRLTCQSI